VRCLDHRIVFGVNATAPAQQIEINTLCVVKNIVNAVALMWTPLIEAEAPHRTPPGVQNTPATATVTETATNSQ
jgi:hypothetical protein